MDEFTFLDGERLVRFGAGALDDAPELIAGRGLDGYVLLATKRSVAMAPELADASADVLHVAGGSVPEAAAAVRADVRGRPIVALGGGRVIDAAKAIAGADGLRCAAVPTTLSGAEMSGFHRMPAGVEVFRLVRPVLVIAAATVMASQPAPDLAASAMNALAHAVEALYTPLANPIANMAALRGAGLLASGLEPDEPNRDDLALGALLAGYAVGATGFAIHHALCQTIVRVAGTPHARTNAIMLPHVVRMMSTRAPEAIGKLSVAVGAGGDPAAAADRIAQLAARCGVTRLSEVGFERAKLTEVVATAAARGDVMANTPGAPTEMEIKQILEEAL
ncbi:MAG: iron-containing alcohol dehydrogenase [Solirubrobacterales bacterium]